MTYRQGGRHRVEAWQLVDEYALIRRNDETVLVPLRDATAAELASGIASVEALAVHIVDSYLRAKRARLRDDQRQDAVAFLVEQAWIEGRRFNGRGRLGAFVTSRLRWRLMDWYRVEFEKPSTIDVLSRDAADDDVARAEAEAGRWAWETRTGATSLDRDGLSAEATWALDHVAAPLAEGWTMRELAQRLERSVQDLEAALDTLRGEVVRAGSI